jgi:type I restriction enzyme R subunit
MAVFNEDNTTEQMIIHALNKNGWEYIPPEKLDRQESDVIVESMVRNALIA